MLEVQARPWVGALMAVAAAVLFAINGTVAKQIMAAGLDAPQLTALRAAGAGLSLLMIFLMAKPQALVVRRGEWGLLISYGLMAAFLTPILYFTAIQRLPVGIGLLLEFTAPVFIALWVRFVQGNRTKPRLWFGLVLCLIGLAAVAHVKGQLRLDGVGVAAGIGAAITLSAYYLLGEQAVKLRDPFSLTCYALLISAVAGAIIRPWWQFPFSALAHHTDSGLPIWVLVCYVIVLGTLVPYLLLGNCLKHIPPTSAGIIGTVEPLVAAAVAWLVLGEVLNNWQMVGGLLVLTGVMLAETARTSIR